jgi:RNA polymerase sigma-70 factor (ECF subfamily)
MQDPELNTTALLNLLTQARAGDNNAQNELVQRAMARLESLARKMLRSYPAVRRWEDTADVLQTALIRLMRALESVTPATTRDFFGLAAEQMRRVLLDLVRHYRGPHGLDRNYRSGVAAAPGEAPQVPDAVDSAPDPDDMERWAIFHEAVVKLPVEEREVFMLSFYHGWTQPQIAVLFGVDERTIRRRWRSAGEKLHAAVGGVLPNQGES